MLEAPEAEPHLHHKTGHSLADKILAVLAIFLSCVSVFIAVHHGKTMERLVEANSWPNISYSTSNADEASNNHNIIFTLRNTGVGPARIDSFEVFYKDRPMKDALSLALACCEPKKSSYSTSLVVDEVLPAREQINFISLPNTPINDGLWDRVNVERFAVRIRICYCSVFDECWSRNSEQRRPNRVAECQPTQPVQYH